MISNNYDLIKEIAINSMEVKKRLCEMNLKKNWKWLWYILRYPEQKNIELPNILYVMVSNL